MKIGTRDAQLRVAARGLLFRQFDEYAAVGISVSPRTDKWGWRFLTEVDPPTRPSRFTSLDDGEDFGRKIQW